MERRASASTSATRSASTFAVADSICRTRNALRWPVARATRVRGSLSRSDRARLSSAPAWLRLAVVASEIWASANSDGSEDHSPRTSSSRSTTVRNCAVAASQRSRNADSSRAQSAMTSMSDDESRAPRSGTTRRQALQSPSCARSASMEPPSDLFCMTPSTLPGLDVERDCYGTHVLGIVHGIDPMRGRRHGRARRGGGAERRHDSGGYRPACDARTSAAWRSIMAG